MGSKCACVHGIRQRQQDRCCPDRLGRRRLQHGGQADPPLSRPVANIPILAPGLPAGIAPRKRCSRRRLATGGVRLVMLTGAALQSGRQNGSIRHAALAGLVAQLAISIAISRLFLHQAGAGIGSADNDTGTRRFSSGIRHSREFGAIQRVSQGHERQTPQHPGVPSVHRELSPQVAIRTLRCHNGPKPGGSQSSRIVDGCTDMETRAFNSDAAAQGAPCPGWISGPRGVYRAGSGMGRWGSCL